MDKHLLLICYIIFIYILISLIEWLSHYYLMHFNGSLKKIMDYYHIKLDNCHIDHHKETKLDQTLPDDCIEEGLVFNILDWEMIVMLIFVILISYLFWNFFPTFKKSFSLIFIIFITFIISNLYFYIWGSIHSNYHKRYIDVNVPLKNNPDKIIYSPLKYFIPNQNSYIFKYLFWYHTLHHLNKGNEKC